MKPEPTFNQQRAAEVLKDALALGDRKTAEKWGCTEKTVRNYRERLKTDADFSAFFHAKIQAEARGWALVRTRALRKALTKAEELIEKVKDPKDLGVVLDAIKTIGELQVATEALSLDNVDSGADQQSEESSEASRYSKADEPAEEP